MSEDLDRGDFGRGDLGSGDLASSPFAGLVPTRLREGPPRISSSPAAAGRHLAPRDSSRVTRNVLATMPIVLVGTLAMSALNLGGAHAENSEANRNQKPRFDTSDLGSFDTVSKTTSATIAAQPQDADTTTGGTLTVASVTVPSTYKVRSGDTVSGIAGRYGLSTASVLALNGLSWKSLIFPGQVLKLTKTTSSKPAVSTTSTPPKPSTPTAPSTSASTGSKYTIKAGDTITAIAKKFGLTVSAVLAANNLKATSIIYAGRTLIIPSTTTSSSTGSSGSSGSSGSGTQTSQVGSVVVPLSPTMKTNAQTIISVGKNLGVPSYGIIVALAAAAQESGLIDLTSGDRDSVGLFQQRPSTGWGTKAQLLNTTYAAELFYGGPSNPNKGVTRGLLDIPGWQSMTVTQAAQAVQISATPTAYAKWETSARAWFAQLG
jgi:N-acetylmuramoyl-L-alanine amidase